jgi:DNA polymerase eta
MTSFQDDPQRVIIHVDMDCWYCQVEQKRLGIARDVPCAVQQWSGLIAVNYAARQAGITRHMRVQEAVKVCPDLVAIHVEVWGAL